MMRMKGLWRLASVSMAAILFGLCATSGRADEGPLMRAVILPGLIPSVVQQLIPMTVELPADRTDLRAPRIKIVSLVYCGGDGHGGATALGVVYPDEAAPAPEALSAADCSGALAGLASRLAHSAGAPEWVEVIKARVRWTPWQLKFAVADAAGAAKGGGRAPSLNGLGEFKNYPTSNLQILPPPGENYRFDVGIGFLNSTIVIAVFPSGRTANPQPYLTANPLLSAEMSAAPERANVLVDALYVFINDLLRIYPPSYQIPIPLQGMTQTMVAKNIRVSGGDNMMTAAGQLTLGEIAYNGTVRCEGSDLGVSQITLDAPAVNCNSDDLMERLRCQGQQAALAGSSNAVAAALTNYYQGQKFHYSTVDRPLRFTLGDTEFAATFEALKASSRDSTVSEAGRVSIKRIGQLPGGTP
jgi:hypothetical protein